MLPIETDNCSVKNINVAYSKQLLEYNGFKILETVGSLHKVKGFYNYNQLLNINNIFSKKPAFDPVDRTDLAHGPVIFSKPRPWTAPTVEIDLKTAMQRRVTEICSTGKKINIFWSGGIDSTAIVTAFLQYAPDRKQCRIIYSPWSVYEHPDCFELLKSFDDLELVDVSGEVYLEFDLDGLFVSGNAGDEIHASLDESFFAEHGYDFLRTPWKDFFYSKLPDHKFIEFCEQHFSAAGREIGSVLDARWWFYTSTKLTSILNNNDFVFLSSGSSWFDPDRLVGFFDCDHYEQFIYFNTDKIVLSNNYATWKQFLKDFCCEFDGFENWRQNKTKFHSSQVYIYSRKKQLLNNQRYLMLFNNGQKVATKNLQFFSRREWDQIKQNYQHVFRAPDSV
jgi:hypothetical protein